MGKFLKIAFFLLIGILLIWWSLHQIPAKDWNDFTQALRTTRYWIILPVFLMLTFSNYLRALRWRLIMEPLGYKPSVSNTFLAVLIGYLANLAVPRLGEVLKCTLISKYEKVPAEKIVGTIVAERAFDVVSLLIVFILALIFQFPVISAGWEQLKAFANQNNHSSNNHLFQYVFIGIIALTALLLFLFRSKLQKTIKGLNQIIKGVWEGLISATKLKKHNLFFLYSFGIWFMYLSATFVGLYGTPGTESSLSTALSCLAFGSIGMIITPGGIGAYALLMAKVLELNGIKYSLGIANGTVQWFSQFIILLILGGIGLILLPIINKKAK